MSFDVNHQLQFTLIAYKNVVLLDRFTNKYNKCKQGTICYNKKPKLSIVIVSIIGSNASERYF